MFESYIEHSNMEDFIKVPKFYLRISACWPLGKKTNFAWIYYIYNFLMAYLISLTFATSLSIDIYLSLGQLDELADASYFFMTELTFLFKFLIFSWKRKSFLHLLTMIEDPIYFQYRPEQKKYLKYWAKISCGYSHMFFFCCYVCAIFFAIYPIMDKNEDIILPFRGWFPFDVKENLFNRGCVYVFQMMGLLIAICVNASLDVLPSNFMNIGCAQIEILKDNLETATFRAEKENKVTRKIDDIERKFVSTGLEVCSLLDGQSDDIVFNTLCKCIKHHQAIIQLLSKIEEMFSAGMLIQLLDTVITICITGLQLIMVSEKSLKYFTIISYLLALTFQVTCYCWNGHQVTIQSSSIADCCYNMDWYRCSSRVKKIIYIIMERCKKPKYMTAGSIFTLSVVTLTMLLRTSYSYFAVLRRVYNRE